MDNNEAISLMRKKFHDALIPFNKDREFIVLFGGTREKPSIALLQLDGGGKIDTNNMGFSIGGRQCEILVTT